MEHRQEMDKETTASIRCPSGGREEHAFKGNALDAFTWGGALRPDLPQQIHQPGNHC